MKFKDPTHGNLEAAILDQAVAGMFNGKTYAYVAVIRETGKPWGIGVAVLGETGYNPIASETFTWDKEEDAKEFCDGMNFHIRLDTKEVSTIIASTMRNPRYSQNPTP